MWNICSYWSAQARKIISLSIIALSPAMTTLPVISWEFGDYHMCYHIAGDHWSLWGLISKNWFFLVTIKLSFSCLLFASRFLFSISWEVARSSGSQTIMLGGDWYWWWSDWISIRDSPSSLDAVVFSSNWSFPSLFDQDHSKWFGKD